MIPSTQAWFAGSERDGYDPKRVPWLQQKTRPSGFSCAGKESAGLAPTGFDQLVPWGGKQHPVKQKMRLLLPTIMKTRIIIDSFLVLTKRIPEYAFGAYSSSHPS